MNETKTEWMAIRIPMTGKWHAVTDDYSSGSRTLVFMEDLIMNPGPDEYVEHIDGDTLNNQKHNLKIAKRFPIEYKGFTIEKEHDLFAVRYYQKDPDMTHDFQPWCDSIEEAKQVIDKLESR